MNMAYFGTPKGVQKPRPKMLVSSTILAVLKGTENLAYVFIPKGETDKTSNSNYQRENQTKCPTLFPDLLWKCALMQKHKFYRKK